MNATFLGAVLVLTPAITTLAAPPKSKPAAKAPAPKLTEAQLAERLDAETDNVRRFVKQCENNRAARPAAIKKEIADLLKKRPLSDFESDWLNNLRKEQKEIPKKDLFDFAVALTDKNAEVGSIGYGVSIRVAEIRDNQEFIGEVSFPTVPEGQALSRDWVPKKRRALVQGVSTEGLTDDSALRRPFDELWEIAETRKVDGQTVFVLRPVDLKAVRERLGR